MSLFDKKINLDLDLKKKLDLKVKNVSYSDTFVEYNFYDDYKFDNEYIKLLIYGDEEIVNFFYKILEEISEINTKDFKIRKFSNLYVPHIDILDYVKRLRKYFNCSDCVFSSSLIYIDRFIKNSDVVLDKTTIHLIFTVSLVISVKYLEDEHFSNEYYSKVGSVVLQELNEIESYMMKILDWNLKITSEDFINYFNN
jgi:hypothetical protein